MKYNQVSTVVTADEQKKVDEFFYISTILKTVLRKIYKFVCLRNLK